MQTPSWQVKQNARCQTLERVMKKLGRETIELHGKDLKHVVHYNPKGRFVSGGKVSWLTPL